jgi:hypothetical protein
MPRRGTAVAEGVYATSIGDASRKPIARRSWRSREDDAKQAARRQLFRRAAMIAMLGIAFGDHRLPNEALSGSSCRPAASHMMKTARREKLATKMQGATTADGVQGAPR